MIRTPAQEGEVVSGAYLLVLKYYLAVTFYIKPTKPYNILTYMLELRYYLAAMFYVKPKYHTTYLRICLYQNIILQQRFIKPTIPYNTVKFYF